MIASFARQSVTIIRPGTKTERGSIVFDWEKPTEKDVTGCSVQPASTGLSEDGRVLGINDGYTLYLPPTADIQAGDHVRYDGNEYEIRGEPRPWVSATGSLDHIMCNLVRYSG